MSQLLKRLKPEETEILVKKRIFGKFTETKNNTYFVDGKGRTQIIRNIITDAKKDGFQAVEADVKNFVNDMCKLNIKNQKTEFKSKPATKSVFSDVIDVMREDLKIQIREDLYTGIIKFFQGDYKFSMKRQALIRKVREYCSCVGVEMPDEKLVNESIDLYKDKLYEEFMVELLKKIKYKPTDNVDELWNSFAKLIHGEKYIPLYAKVWKVFFHNLKKSIYELPQKEVFIPVIYGFESTGKSNILNRIFIESGILHFSKYSKVGRITDLFDERSAFRLTKNIIIVEEFAGIKDEHISELKGKLDGTFVDYRILGLNEEERAQRNALFISSSNKRMSINLNTDEPIGFRKFVELEIPKRVGKELMDWGFTVGKVDFFKLLSTLDENDATDFNKDVELWEEYIKYTTACGLKKTETVSWFEEFIKRNEGKVVEIEAIWRDYNSEDSGVVHKQQQTKINEKIEGFLFKPVKAGYVKVPKYEDCYFFHYEPDSKQNILSKVMKDSGVFDEL